MISRELKLKPTKTQEITLDFWLLSCASIYNWAIRKIELNANNKIYFDSFEFHNILSGHSKKLGIPSCVIQSILVQAFNAWKRCFRKESKKPRFKSKRNKLNSICFSRRCVYENSNRISLPIIGSLKVFKQNIPEGIIKQARIIKRPSGWYCLLVIDTIHKFPVKDTNESIGIDPGFSTLMTLSNGVKIENPRELRKGEQRIAQAQRGKRRKLVSILQERQVNKRKDRNHKISRKLIEDYKTIYYSNDNLKSLSKRFGKSVTESSLSRLIGMITYKGRIGGRAIIPVSSKFTTMTCSNCGSLSGPTGLNGLVVRNWGCSACGAQHDRDVNSARVVLNSGLRLSLKPSETMELTETIK